VAGYFVHAPLSKGHRLTRNLFSLCFCLPQELPDDTEQAPNLHGEAIQEKLEQYLRKQSNEVEGADDKDDEDEAPTSVEAQHRLQVALEQRYNELDHRAKVEREKSNVKAMAGRQQSTVNNETGPRVTINPDAGADGADRSSNGSAGLFSMCFGGPSRRKSAAGHRVLEMQGWVTKRGGRIKTWKRRYMVITSVGIVYFKNPEEADGSGEAQGQIEWSEMTPVAGVVCNAVPSVMTGKVRFPLFSFDVVSIFGST